MAKPIQELSIAVSCPKRECSACVTSTAPEYLSAGENIFNQAPFCAYVNMIETFLEANGTNPKYHKNDIGIFLRSCLTQKSYLISNSFKEDEGKIRKLLKEAEIHTSIIKESKRMPYVVDYFSSIFTGKYLLSGLPKNAVDRQPTYLYYVTKRIIAENSSWRYGLSDLTGHMGYSADVSGLPLTRHGIGPKTIFFRVIDSEAL